MAYGTRSLPGWDLRGLSQDGCCQRRDDESAHDCDVAKFYEASRLILCTQLKDEVMMTDLWGDLEGREKDHNPYMYSTVQYLILMAEFGSEILIQ